ncbi:bax inhibitor-1 family protein [Artemisia annua]|uniref:Bax inhibitor-1 family protein n=1 Tax=Artemisia annua TaxID=35608 RepID=A0A2U1LI74_ARTAN|nr:bax inhibitor-1 family protein [Artemisia annua]
MFEFTRISTKSDHEEDIDLEQGTITLYPGISHGENVLRWGFIRKVYGILAAQMVLTTLVSFATVLYAPVNEMLRGNSGLLLFMVFLPFIFIVDLGI